MEEEENDENWMFGEEFVKVAKKYKYLGVNPFGTNCQIFVNF